MSVTTNLIKCNKEALQEGAELLSLLEPNQYEMGFTPAFQSTIGAHFRHVLEHYRCFFSQLNGKIFCYDKREREQKLEQCMSYAVESIKQMIVMFDDLDQYILDGDFFVTDSQSDGLVATSMQRELLFLQSHTVHHYAIIAAMSRALGTQPQKNFGVAIATQFFEKQQAQASSLCAP